MIRARFLHLVVCWLLCCLAGGVRGQVTLINKPVRVACVGNSVTYGSGLKNRAAEAYPAVLQKLLGKGYEVGNFGRSGATLLKKGHNPYFLTEEFSKALAFKPDVAIIHLGLNDTDPRNWPDYQSEFEADYAWLLDTFKKVNPNVKLFVSKLSPVFSGHPRFRSGTRDWHREIQELMPGIAKANGARLLDLNKPLANRPDLFADNLHPDQEGAEIIARTVYQALSGDFGGLKIPQLFSNHMVLQRDKPIPLYGTANAGELVRLSLGKENLTAKADQEGNWKVIFPALPAGGPYTLNIRTADKSVLFSDILIGDVWFAAGQSNMAFELKNAQGGAEALRQPLNKNLHLFKMQNLRETNDTAWDSLSMDQTNKLAFFRGSWKTAEPASSAGFSAVAWYFARELQSQENIPIGIIDLSVGGAPIESFIDRESLTEHDLLVNMLSGWRNSDFLMPWVRERANKNLELSTRPVQRHPYEPAYNYEAGIAQLIHSPIKGVIWYQGESNAHNSGLYRIAFKSLAESWRKNWKQPELPIYFVQLSSLNRPSWPEFRNMQRELQKEIPNTRMAVSLDLGDSLNVHPLKKQEIGQRLALLALKNTYHKDLTDRGPEALHAVIKEQEVIVSFTETKKLSTSDGTDLKGFELLSDQGKSIPLSGRISGTQVILPIPAGLKFKALRYAWQPFSRANLINEAGLPASTFAITLKEE